MTPEQIKKWIWDRCDECGDCLEWRQASKGGAPVCRLPGAKAQAQARRVLMGALGKHIEDRLCTTNCGNPLCMAEDHVMTITRKALQKRSAKRTAYGSNPVRSAKLAAARRKTAVLTLDKVQDMRERGLSSREAAREFGVSQSAANHALTGRTWKNYSTPFAGLM